MAHPWTIDERKRIGRFLDRWLFVVPITVAVIVGNGILASLLLAVAGAIGFELILRGFFRLFPTFRPDPHRKVESDHG